MDWNAIVERLTDKVTGWVDASVALLPNLAVAVVVVVLAVVLAGVARRSTRWSLRKVLPNEQLVDLAAGVVRLAVIAVGVLTALGVLELDKTVTSLLAGVGVVGLALGFAFQDIAANFMAGVLMAFRQPVRNGDLIETNGFLGTVEQVDLRATTVRTFTGEAVLIPNKDVWGSAITNYTESEGRRVDVACGVAYDTDLEEAERLVLAALEDLPGRDPGREVTVVWTGFGGSSIDFSARVWLTDAGQARFLASQSAVIKRIKASFDAHGIEIPFPIRTMHLPDRLRVVDDRASGEAATT